MRISKISLQGPFGAAMKVSILLWTFGMSMVVILTAMRGRGTPLEQSFVQTPLWLAAVLLSTGLYWAWSRSARQPAAIRLPIMALACFVAGLTQSVIDLSFLRWMSMTLFPEWQSWTEISMPRFASVLILYTWTFCLNATLFWALSTSETAREQSRRAAVAEAETQRAQLAALRLQLNPHFLFNTLNAISAMVLSRDVERADKMIERLSEFLRASLMTDPNALIVLGEEFDTIEAYLEIEAVRFEGRLQVRFLYDEALRGALVPGFILQPLVENAMKYAVAPAMRLVTVTVRARAEGDDLILVVADDGDPAVASSRPKGTGVGLGNTSARLANLYGARGRLTPQPSPEGFSVEVRLPLSMAGPDFVGAKPGPVIA